MSKMLILVLFSVNMFSLVNADGPYDVDWIYESDGLRNGPYYLGATLYYPINALEPLASIVIVPGWGMPESSIQNWGPFFASWGIIAMTIGTNNPSTDWPEDRAEALLDAIETIRQENNRIDSPVNGRIDLNVVPGGIKGEFEKMGENIDHDTRYERAAEFIAALRKLWESPESIDFKGEHIQLNNVHCSPGPLSDIQFYLGGASPAALKLAGSQSDIYLGWISKIDEVEKHLQRARKSFSDFGRNSSFGLRTHVIMRNVEEDAWAEASELLSQASNSVKKQRTSLVSGTTMVGAAEQAREFEDYKVDKI